MKINCGPSAAEREKRLQEWHPHFALLPRRVGENDCRWLEWIERKGTFCDYRYYDDAFWSWEYRAKQEVSK